MTLRNGRIKDGPTPVKAPHTRRRLNPLSSTILLARHPPLDGLPPSPPSSFLFYRPISSRRTCLSPAFLLASILVPFDLGRLVKLARQFARSLARSLFSSVNTHPSLPVLTRDALFCPSRATLSLPTPSAPYDGGDWSLSLSLSLIFLPSPSLSPLPWPANSATLYKQDYVHARWNVWGLVYAVACVYRRLYFICAHVCV